MPLSSPQASVEPSEEKDMLARYEPWLVANWLAGNVIVQWVSVMSPLGGVTAVVSSVIAMCWMVPPLSGPSSVITAHFSPLRDITTWYEEALPIASSLLQPGADPSARL